MTKKKDLSDHGLNHGLDVKALRFGIVVSKWNGEITESLLRGCKDTLVEYGVDDHQIYIVEVPGSFELPAAARMLDDKHNLDAIICLGCVIQGDTKHNEYINQAVATGLIQLGIMRSKPCIFGVLTPDNMQQAKDRAGGKHGNKGTEAAATAIQMAQLRRDLRGPKNTIGF